MTSTMIHVKHRKPETDYAELVFTTAFVRLLTRREWINAQRLFHVKRLSLDLCALMANNTALETCYEL